MSWLSSKFSKFSQEQKDNDNKKILCPHCGSIQEVSARAELTFCKECKKIINSRKAKEVEEEAIDKEVKQAPVVAKPEIKKTKEFKEYKEPAKTTVNLSMREEPSQVVHSEVRKVNCSHCHAEQEVPTIALSSFCKKCGNRINLQDYEIRGKFQGDLDTRGTIYLSEDAEVRASINVGSVVVRGKIRGEVIAEKSVTLTSTGKIFGKVVTSNFVVEDGAIFVGKAEIEPKSVVK